MKARKLREFSRVVLEEYGDVDALLKPPAGVGPARAAGGGPPAAASDLGHRPRDGGCDHALRGAPADFVVDSYSRRLVERLELLPAVPGEAASGRRRYERERRLFLDRIGQDVPRLNQWHALVVRHGQTRCHRRDPACGECPLLARCPMGQRELGLAG